LILRELKKKTFDQLIHEERVNLINNHTILIVDNFKENKCFKWYDF